MSGRVNNDANYAWGDPVAIEAGYEGNCKLGEHYLNGRLKTVTGYFGQDFRHLLDLKLIISFKIY
jgi:hypothetical protein